MPSLLSLRLHGLQMVCCGVLCEPAQNDHGGEAAGKRCAQCDSPWHTTEEHRGYRSLHDLDDEDSSEQ